MYKNSRTKISFLYSLISSYGYVNYIFYIMIFNPQCIQKNQRLSSFSSKMILYKRFIHFLIETPADRNDTAIR